MRGFDVIGLKSLRFFTDFELEEIMPQEIERKFLVKGDGWREGAAGTVLRQGYILSDEWRSVRVRVAGERAWITVKGNREGLTRAEYEYEIPAPDANEILDTLCEGAVIEKSRYEVQYEGLTWEVDVFAGENQGLVMAEVELESENQPLALPDWIGEEVSHDPRYLNVNLSKRPYTGW